MTHKVTRLLQTFELFAMQYFASDDDAHRENQHQAVRGMFDILHKLDDMQPNQRQALERLFTHPSAEVRVFAATYLVKIIPERATPVLEAVHAEYRGLPPGMVAMTTLFAYKHGELNA